MDLIDAKFKKYPVRYLLQTSLATFTLLAFLLVLDVLHHTAILAALGASTFVVFSMPGSYSAKAKSLVGGYIVGIASGCAFGFIHQSGCCVAVLASHHVSLALFGGLAVGISILIMVVTNTEHAPAAGMALGLVLTQWNLRTIILIFSAVVALAIARRALKPLLIDLI